MSLVGERQKNFLQQKLPDRKFYRETKEPFLNLLFWWTWLVRDGHGFDSSQQPSKFWFDISVQIYFMTLDCKYYVEEKNL